MERATTQVSQLIEDSISRQRLRKHARSIWSLYPELRASTERLAHFCADVIHDQQGNALLDTCLKSACERYMEIDNLPHEPSQATKLREAYMVGLLDGVVRLMEVKVHVRIGSSHEVWDPLFEPLTQFMMRHPTRRIGVVHEPFEAIDPEHFRLAIASRIFSASNLACMRPVFERIGVGTNPVPQ